MQPNILNILRGHAAGPRTPSKPASDTSICIPKPWYNVLFACIFETENRSICSGFNNMCDVTIKSKFDISRTYFYYEIEKYKQSFDVNAL